MRTILALTLAATLAASATALADAASALPPAQSPQIAPTAAAARLAGGIPFGVSDQSAAMFTDPRFAWLRIRYARLVLPWDTADQPAARRRAAAWLSAARAAGAEPLVAFDAGVVDIHRLPRLSAYEREVGRFMARFPWVRSYQPWNEEDQGGALTFHDPARAAAFFNWLQHACSGCTVAAADLLDSPDMSWWVHSFLRYAHGPRLWGLHPYYELSYGGQHQLASLLQQVPGRIWFTEAGYPIWRYVRLAHRFVIGSDYAQSLAVRRMLRLARVGRRVTRVYFYQWRSAIRLAQSRAQHRRGRRVTATWDSGLFGPDCRPRPALWVLARALGLEAGTIPRVQAADSGRACLAPASAQPARS